MVGLGRANFANLYRVLESATTSVVSDQTEGNATKGNFLVSDALQDVELNALQNTFSPVLRRQGL
ncbi:hypothetical protein FHS27_004699 [Rhodopirellula rubra]|uniref:Uncharacterized protein n=1 Tax=Aporhodopirellula rubra TaxID=980271 RepID=A0A7W5E286_9BACT|nr:hypothetical protein [Aporhodopirellula rubra]